VFKELGLRAHVLATDVSSARGMKADIFIAQELHTPEFEGLFPVVISVKNFIDKKEMREKIAAAMEKAGWKAA
ncbi:MAG: PTS sugar transporter subunit IIB, partial [Actinomycetota bacterium]